MKNQNSIIGWSFNVQASLFVSKFFRSYDATKICHLLQPASSSHALDRYVHKKLVLLNTSKVVLRDTNSMWSHT